MFVSEPPAQELWAKESIQELDQSSPIEWQNKYLFGFDKSQILENSNDPKLSLKLLIPQVKLELLVPIFLLS